MKPRVRDAKGRFCKVAKPAPALIDPEILKSLGQHRRAVDLTLDHQWDVEIISRSHYTVPSSDSE
jgi:hypothetical protein